MSDYIKPRPDLLLPKGCRYFWKHAKDWETAKECETTLPEVLICLVYSYYGTPEERLEKIFDRVFNYDKDLIVCERKKKFVFDLLLRLEEVLPYFLVTYILKFYHGFKKDKMVDQLTFDFIELKVHAGDEFKHCIRPTSVLGMQFMWGNDHIYNHYTYNRPLGVLHQKTCGDIQENNYHMTYCTFWSYRKNGEVKDIYYWRNGEILLGRRKIFLLKHEYIPWAVKGASIGAIRAMFARAPNGDISRRKKIYKFCYGINYSTVLKNWREETSMFTINN